MKLVVGLGNPGKEYERTRHNVGFMVIDRLSTKSEIRNSKQILLVKPETYMNRSGTAVKKLIGNWKLKIENLYVVHDDLDIPLGKYKIQKGKGPKDHRGILSIEMALGKKDFWRVRIGVDNRSQIADDRSQMTGDEYVLSRFPAEELAVVNLVIDRVVGELCSKWEIG